ncbi:hypothetical protein Hanom_Chr11g01022861 [Helianthus anomalus]
MGMSQPQGSSFNPNRYVEMFQHQGSYFHQQGSSARPQGSMDHQTRSSMQTFSRSCVFQDQGSSGRQPMRTSEVHEGDFIPMQTIAFSCPTITT